MSFDGATFDFSFSLAEALRVGTPFDYSLHVTGVCDDFLKSRLSFDKAIYYIDLWRRTPQFLCWETEVNGSSKFVYSLCSKRGNAVYRWRVNLKLKDFMSSLESFDDMSLIVKDSHGCRCGRFLMLVATVDPKVFSLVSYNSKECSRFIELFRKRINRLFPGVRIARTFESFKNPYSDSRGFLHVNFILFLPESVRVYQHVSKRSGMVTWRLSDRLLLDSVKRCWMPGFCDVQAVATGHALLEYCFKYVTKYFRKDSCVRDQAFNNSVLTLFRKRSYSLPESFKKAVCDFLLSNSSPRLDNVLHNSAVVSELSSETGGSCRFVGVFCGEELNIVSDDWFFESSEPPPNSARTDFYNSDVVLPVRDIVALLVHDTGWRMPYRPEFSSRGRSGVVYFEVCLDV